MEIMTGSANILVTQLSLEVLTQSPGLSGKTESSGLAGNGGDAFCHDFEGVLLQALLQSAEAFPDLSRHDAPEGVIQSEDDSMAFTTDELKEKHNQGMVFAPIPLPVDQASPAVVTKEEEIQSSNQNMNNRAGVYHNEQDSKGRTDNMSPGPAQVVRELSEALKGNPKEGKLSFTHPASADMTEKNIQSPASVLAQAKEVMSQQAKDSSRQKVSMEQADDEVRRMTDVWHKNGAPAREGLKTEFAAHVSESQLDEGPAGGGQRENNNGLELRQINPNLQQIQAQAGKTSQAENAPAKPGRAGGAIMPGTGEVPHTEDYEQVMQTEKVSSGLRINSLYPSTEGSPKILSDGREDEATVIIKQNSAKADSTHQTENKVFTEISDQPRQDGHFKSFAQNGEALPAQGKARGAASERVPAGGKIEVQLPNATMSFASAQKMSDGDISPAQIIERISARFIEIADKEGGRVKINLSPPTLGNLEMDVMLRNGTLKVVLIAENRDVHHTLSANMESLRGALQNHGLIIERCEVMLQDRHEQYQQGFNQQQAFGRDQSGRHENNTVIVSERESKEANHVAAQKMNRLAWNTGKISLFA
ncbi:MAG TPA: flagellar hook-length control protein FliK [Smithellaceae bacterium]|jgi:flagellar hook-length control protein FliK|nr:flagellar hook-length control protein FliK [Syntrophaceae bacterium]HPV49387.1 flagellar hook-length control protein FliK [Smithellaceae bacterium]